MTTKGKIYYALVLITALLIVLVGTFGLLTPGILFPVGATTPVFFISMGLLFLLLWLFDRMVKRYKIN